jgi:hypothetical protein
MPILNIFINRFFKWQAVLFLARLFFKFYFPQQPRDVFLSAGIFLINHKKVEIGTGNGLTSILIARAGAEHTYEKPMKCNGGMRTIDCRDDGAMQLYLRRFGIDCFVGNSTNASFFTAGEIDFLFIDACHKYRSVKADYQAWFHTVKAGSPILFHDMDNKHKDHAGVWAFYQRDIQQEIKAGRLIESDFRPIFPTVTKAFFKAIPR